MEQATRVFKPLQAAVTIGFVGKVATARNQLAVPTGYISLLQGRQLCYQALHGACPIFQWLLHATAHCAGCSHGKHVSCTSQSVMGQGQGTTLVQTRPVVPGSHSCIPLLSRLGIHANSNTTRVAACCYLHEVLVFYVQAIMPKPKCC